jgi:SAM-dependent methyltransferase
MAKEHNYIFETHENNRELQRLRLVESAFDSASETRLRAAGICRGAACLEIGAGAGSIPRWMGDRVGPSGLIFGVDLNTTYLSDLNRPPWTVIEGDFLDANISTRFDLVHIRYVLIHNVKPNAILSSVLKTLRPGGCLIIEEPDFTVAQAGGSGHRAEIDRTHRAISRMFESMGLSPDFAASLPSRLRDLGFLVDRVEIDRHFGPGGSQVAKVMAASTDALRERYIATGEATQNDLDTPSGRQEIRCTFYANTHATRPHRHSHNDVRHNHRHSSTSIG